MQWKVPYLQGFLALLIFLSWGAASLQALDQDPKMVALQDKALATMRKRIVAALNSLGKNQLKLMDKAKRQGKVFCRKPRADLNGDGVIDDLDFQILRTCVIFSTPKALDCLAVDQTGDGVIDQADIDLWKTASTDMTTYCYFPPVPTPRPTIGPPIS